MRRPKLCPTCKPKTGTVELCGACWTNQCTIDELTRLLSNLSDDCLQIGALLRERPHGITVDFAGRALRRASYHTTAKLGDISKKG